MRKQKFLKRLLATSAVGSLLVLAGCASEDAGDSEGDSEVVFIDVIGTDPPHLNPQINFDISTGQVGQAIFEPLVKMDSNFEPVGILATSWTSNDDATEHTFELREDVSWHDGEPFTSADVKFNLEEVFPFHSIGTNVSAQIESIETPDDHTVVVHTREPFGPLIGGLTGMHMIPAHLYEGSDITVNPTNEAPVGTGPFRFEEWVKGDRITVVKNPDYWAESGNIDRVVFKLLPDVNARMLALQSGEVDRITSSFVDNGQLNNLEGDEYFISPDGRSLSIMTLFTNSRQGPMADPEVRAALYRAMDRQAMADNVFYGNAVPARGPIPSEVSWATDPETNFAEDFAYDPEAAGALLDEAGYPMGADGSRFTVKLRVPASLNTVVGTGEVIKANLEAIGVNVDLVAEDLNVFVEAVFTTHDFDMSILPMAPYEDPSIGIARQYVCNPDDMVFLNPSGVCDEQLDAAFAAAATSADPEVRAGHFAATEQRIAELLHIIPLVEDATPGVVRQDRWAGVEEFFGQVNFDWTKLNAR